MKVRLKVIIDSSIFKTITIITIVSLFFLAMFLPSIINPKPKGSLIAYNRDATSGTRESFIENVLGETPEEFSPGMNVREVSNNDSMINSVEKNKNTIGYVSFGTIAKFKENGEPTLKDEFSSSSKISFSDLNGISPSKENINNGSYDAVRNFNMFFRVGKDSVESNILTYDWSTGEMDNKDLIHSLDNDTLKCSYLFYSWVLYSNEAWNTLEINYEIPYTYSRIDFDNVYQEYIDNVGLNTNSKLEIEIVGSTSAKKTIDILSNEFESEAENEWGFNDVEFIIATNGSSDAFKQTVPGATNSYIGLQSREAKESELSNWGWDKGSIAYKPYAIDAILLIYNVEGTKELLNNGQERLDFDSKKIDDLYSSQTDYFLLEDIIV